jgi:hypothetical protein
MSKQKGNSLAGVYVGVAGVLYTLTGLVEIVTGFGIGVGPLEVFGRIFQVVGDPFNGFVLLVIGLVFLKGAGPAGSGDREGVSYVAGGALLATALLGFYILNALSNGLGFILGFEDWLEWTILDDLKPGVVLWIFALPSVLLARDPKWRK